jgi:tripartite-type tricarboxylate transporter receptor subunit TctC
MRRRWLAVSLLLASGWVAGTAAAQTYPSKVIKMIVPFSAGGQPDVIARLFAQYLAAGIGPTIVDNRPGANTTIGSKTAAEAEPDGHTLLYGSATSLALAPALNKSPGYDPVKSFAPIATFSTSPFMLFVGKSVPESVKTVDDFIAYAKQNPGKLNFAAPTGGPPHLAGELFKRAVGIDMVPVSYRSLNQAFTDMIGGQMDVLFDGPAPMMPLLAEGKVRVLVSLGARHSASLPEVKTMKEAGLPDVQLETWNGLVAPAGTPVPIIQRLNTVVNDGLKSKEIQQALFKFASDPFISTPEEFSAVIVRESRKWADLVAAANLKIE